MTLGAIERRPSQARRNELASYHLKGKSLSRALSMLVACGVLVLAITDTVLNGRPWFEKLNVAATQALTFRGERAFDALMTLFTITGSDAVLFLFALGTAGWLWRMAKRRDAMVLLCSALAARILVLVIKVIVSSERPFMKAPPWPLIEVYDFGYPSGHTIMSLVILGFTSVLVLRYRAGSTAQTIVGASLWIFILGISFSRIYLGFHWLNDVVGGYLYGFVVLMAADASSQSEREVFRRPEPS